MTAPRWHDDAFALLRRGLAPAMPDAACLGNAALFDGDTPAHTRQAQAICRTCPELDPCRQWADNTPGLLGVIAGQHKKDNDQ